MTANLKMLKKLMKDHDLNCPSVAKLLDRKPQTIRTWRSGRYPIPDHAIKLLKLQLE
jgi:hypothetical protein